MDVLFGAGRFVAAVSSPLFRRHRFVVRTLRRQPFCRRDTSSPAISSWGHFVAGTFCRLPFRRGDISSLEHEQNSPELAYMLLNIIHFMIISFSIYIYDLYAFINSNKI